MKIPLVESRNERESIRENAQQLRTQPHLDPRLGKSGNRLIQSISRESAGGTDQSMLQTDLNNSPSSIKPDTPKNQPNF